MYIQKTLSVLIQNIQNYKSVFSKDTLYIKFFNFLKMSLEKTFLENVFLEDTFYVTKTTLYRNITKPILFKEFFISFKLNV